MSAAAIHAMLAAASPASPAPAPLPGAPGDGEFSALLGGMKPHASPAKPETDTASRSDTRAETNGSGDAPPLAALQSLEAVLAGLGALATAGPASLPASLRPAAPQSPARTSTPAASATAAAAPLSKALAAASFAFDGESATGDAVALSSLATPLKTQLENDPSLGLSGFQMKTFLAAAEATPARSGATPLRNDSAWSPLAVAAGPSARAPSEPGFASTNASAAGSTSANEADRAVSEGPLASTAAAPLSEYSVAIASPTAPVTRTGPAVQSAPDPQPRPATALSTTSALPASAPTEAAPDATILSAFSAFAFSPSGEVVVSPRAANTPAATVANSGATAPAAPAASEPLRQTVPPRAAASAPRAAASHSGSASGQAQAAANPTTDATASAGHRAADVPGAAQSGGAAASAAVAPSATAAPAATPQSILVSLADLPAFIANQAGEMGAAGAADAPSAGAAAAAAPTTDTPKAAQAVKELEISLDPADLGAMTLKLRLAGGKLSVTIGVSNPQTLAAIKEDSALITSRLASGDQSLGELVIQRQNLVSSTTEPASSNAFANDSASDESSSEGQSDSPPRRPGASRAPTGGGFGALVV